MTVSDQDNDIDRLCALRNRLAAEIDAAGSPQNVAILSRQFLAVIAHLAEIQPSAPSRVTEIAEKHRARLAAIRSPAPSRKARSAGEAQSG